MDTLPETPSSPETAASPHTSLLDRVILEFVEKVENLSLFQDRIEKPAHIPQIWRAFQEEIRNQIVPAGVALYLVDPSSHTFELNQWTPPEEKDCFRRELDAQIECGTFAWIVNRRQPAIIPSLVFAGPQSLVMLPLTTHARTLGVAMIVTTIEEKAITHERLRLLGILSKQCALVMENTLLYDQLKEEHKELQEAQAQIIQAEKFAAFGRLTSGAFHELLNPLNIISGHLQLMMLAENLEPPWSDYLTLMKTESDRIAAIVNSLLRFSAIQRKEAQELDIARLLREVADEHIKCRASEGITIDYTIDAGLPLIKAPEDDLKAALTHLLDNAYDAMPEGGILGIAAGLLPPPMGPRNNAQRLEVRITDNGCGIAENNVHKVFDPFFTTKDIGQGMGLSLAISYALIGSMGGTITFNSQEKKGTVFMIQLPLSQ